MSSINIPVSVLNLVPTRAGQTSKQAIDGMVELAQTTEKMGYLRYWIAEHHNSPTVLSSATSILIKHTLEHTTHIRVGSGGIMLPNHSPLVVAEQFGTLATIYPDRVDLGLGRAPGTDMVTANALRRSQNDSVYSFPKDIQSLITYFGPEEQQDYVKPYPGVNTNVPIYILGSSTYSAHLAAHLGLPYSFAAHFAPQQMDEAIAIYRAEFKPSEFLDRPYMMICLNVVAAETDEEAKLLATTQDRYFLNIVRGTRNPLQPPVEKLEDHIKPMDQLMLSQMERLVFLGRKDSVREQLTEFQAKYNADEIMVVSYIYDLEKQVRSYELFKEIVDGN